MRQTTENFKVIMRDKNERTEFVGGFLCCVVAMVVLFVVILIFG